MLSQIRDQPQLERVHPREEATVHQRESRRRVLRMEGLDRLLEGLVRRHARHEDALERLEVGGWIYGQQHGGQRDGRLPCAVKDEIERLLGRLVLVLPVEPTDELAALPIREAGEKLLSPRVGRILEHAREGLGLLVEMMLDDV